MSKPTRTEPYDQPMRTNWNSKRYVQCTFDEYMNSENSYVALGDDGKAIYMKEDKGSQQAEVSDPIVESAKGRPMPGPENIGIGCINYGRTSALVTPPGWAFVAQGEVELDDVEDLRYGDIFAALTFVRQDGDTYEFYTSTHDHLYLTRDEVLAGLYTTYGDENWTVFRPFVCKNVMFIEKSAIPSQVYARQQ